MTTAAAKATAAADALLAWLRDQPLPVFHRRESAAPGAGACRRARRWTPPPLGLRRNQPARTGRSVSTPVAPAFPVPATETEAATPLPRTATPFGAGDEHGAPLSLAHTDWLYHHLSITGPDAALVAFPGRCKRRPAPGSFPGISPSTALPKTASTVWSRHHRRASAARDLAGARIVAGQLRDAIARRHDHAVARVGRNRACPFDLQALVLLPADILRRGPDDPVSLQWLWEHWGHHTGVAPCHRGSGRRPGPAAPARGRERDPDRLLVGRLVAVARPGADRRRLPGPALRALSCV